MWTLRVVPGASSRPAGRPILLYGPLLFPLRDLQKSQLAPRPCDLLEHFIKFTFEIYLRTVYTDFARIYPVLGHFWRRSLSL